ncbi:MAG: anthranilate phosphoribosyltransferase [Sphingorhabdus sp.]
MNAVEAEQLFGKMLDGEMSDDAIKATLIEMAERDETSEEIAGAIRAMRARMIRVTAPEGAIDVCGTGGDGAHSLNVSTAVAIVVAACDVPVAKHGNRAAETAEATLADLGIAFLFAQKYHPALGRLAPIRKEIGRRTIFNLTGPACNPAGVKRQLIGVARPDFMPVYAAALELLGYEDAMLVAGDEPLDELSISGASSFVRVGSSVSNITKPFVSSEVETPQSSAQPKGISTTLDANGIGQIGRITPETANLPRHPSEALKGGDAHYNAAALRRLLVGTQESAQDRAYRDAVLFNSAGALIVAGHAQDWHSGVEEAAEAIDKGLAKALLECWISF